MRIECPNCHKGFRIPGERIPKGRKIVFPCPACKGRIRLDMRLDAARSESSAVPNNTSKERRKKNQGRGPSLMACILKALDELPAMPQVLHKAREIMADPKQGNKDLSNILETDQSIVSRVLRLANSAYFGLSGKVSSFHHASVLLGQQALGEIIITAGVSNLLGNSLKGYRMNSGDLWRHSVAVAVGSRMIAEKKRPELSNDAYTAGLIHDAGKMILDQYLLERREEFESFMQAEQETFLVAEKKILGFDHAGLGSQMCKRWNFPAPIALAINHHHYPSRSKEDDLSYIVHVGDYIAMLSGIGYGSDDLLYQMEEGAMDFLGLQQDELNKIMFEVMEAVEKMVGEAQGS